LTFNLSREYSHDIGIFFENLTTTTHSSSFKFSGMTLVLLGAAWTFVIFAGTTITNVVNVGTNLLGDIGTFPGDAITGFPPGVIYGETYLAGSFAEIVIGDIRKAYNNATSQAFNHTLSDTDLGGLTLFPGVYKFDAAAALSAGQLFFDAQGDMDAVWIFQIGTSLDVASGTSMVFTSGLGNANNVFWAVGTSATLNEDVSLIGNILAYTSISCNARVTINGRLLATNGAVSLIQNVVSYPGGPTSPTTSPTLSPSLFTSLPPSVSPSMVPSTSPSVQPTVTPSASSTAQFIGNVTTFAGRRDTSPEYYDDDGYDKFYEDGIGTNAGLYHMNGVCLSPDGTFALLADYKYLVRKIVISTAEVTTVAGVLAYGSSDGIGSNATFYRPVDMSFVSDGSYVLLTDGRNANIRKIVITTNNVTTVAGTAGMRRTANGFGTNANFVLPTGISISPNDSYALIVDYDGCSLRKYEIGTGEVSTLAGGGCGGAIANGIGTNVVFVGPNDVRIAPNGLFALICDYDGNNIRKIIIATGEVTTISGNEGGTSGSTNGYGTNSLFSGPYGLDISPDGIYALISEYGGPSTVRFLDISTGLITTFAGRYASGTSDGLGTLARFNGPCGISISPDGSFALVADYDNYKIRYVDIVTEEAEGEQEISMICPFFVASSTGNATQSTHQCTFLLCPYQVVTISSCATCVGDTLFRLYDPSGSEVAWNDDGVDCDKCSSLSFTYSKSSLFCGLYTLHQGCAGDEACSGEAHIEIESTSSVVPKYGFGVIYGDPSILNMTEGLLVNYHYNTPKSE
jgi:hypothetical protein